MVATISGLTASTTYHFRICSHQQQRHQVRQRQDFYHAKPNRAACGYHEPRNKRGKSLQRHLMGSVDPHGLTTTVHFQYGTTTSYGHTTANQTKTGNAYQNVAANISGLECEH